MKRNRVLRGLKFAALGLLAVGVFGFFTMSLWNWLMPVVFGLKMIGFWQALGLLVLARILFGGLRGGPGRHRIREKWAGMTPEEREKFREGMRHRCGGFRSPEPEAKA